MPQRVTFLFQITTTPQNRSDAAPHTGGWSESWWSNTPVDLGGSFVQGLAQGRARLLPAQGSIVGVRSAIYTLSGNKLLPGGSSTGKLQYPGSASRPTDLPQVALEMTGSTAGQPNASRFTLRGMPDEIMVGGEYQPDSAFRGAVTAFCNRLVTAGWSFVGRDLSKPSANILSIAGGVMTLDASIGAAAGDYVRMRRVYDDDVNPVKGAYRVTLVAGAGTVLTLANMDATVSVANGSARVDEIKLFAFSEVSPSRAVVRKVGRPFAGYRGRQSKR